MDDSAIKTLETIYANYSAANDNIISALQEIQKAFGFVPEESVYWFADKSGVPMSKFYGILTFYAQFHLKPRGKNIITACCGTVCHVKGAHRVLFQLNEELSFPPGEDTTRDGLVTLEKVACLGACSIAPVVVVNDKVCGRITPDNMVKKIQKLRDKDK
ncbi:MAG: NAD(P)H-dependent oxidoreductase subunit E [Desulfobulbaceae bacterium]|nr:NAD(P)H-dependent oxidoreductase subunit E [Desulfobulbaceae bacterium]